MFNLLLTFLFRLYKPQNVTGKQILLKKLECWNDFFNFNKNHVRKPCYEFSCFYFIKLVKLYYLSLPVFMGLYYTLYKELTNRLK